MRVNLFVQSAFSPLALPLSHQARNDLCRMLLIMIYM